MTALIRCAVVVSSTSAAQQRAEDRTGPLITQWAQRHGFNCRAPLVVADGPEVGHAIAESLDAGAQIVITTGGTGFTPDDTTPEETRQFITREAPGIAEAIRAAGRQSTAFAALSRGIAGMAGNSFVVNLPGSPAGVSDGLAVLDEVIEHILQQLGHSDDRGHAPHQRHNHQNGQSV